jgi:hypothetical protein
VQIVWQLYHWLYPQSGWASLARAEVPPSEMEQSTLPRNLSSQSFRVVKANVLHEDVTAGKHQLTLNDLGKRSSQERSSCSPGAQ